MRLFREILPRGYRGRYGLVAAYARRLRHAQGLAPGQRCPRRSLPRVVEPVGQPLTPRRATWLVLRGEAKRTEAQGLPTLVRQRQPTQLDPWLTRVTASTLEVLRRFATGLYEDYEAIKAGA